MNDDFEDRQRNALDQVLVENVEKTNLCGEATHHDIVSVRRYQLEQKFRRNEDEVEEYATAVVSIIGNEPLDEFEDCLAKLSYDYSPECWRGHIAGNWFRNATRLLPEYYMGLISVATFSPASLVALKEEMQRYRQANVFAVIGLPPDANFASLMKRTLEDFGEAAHFVQMAPDSDMNMRSPRGFPEVVIDYVEAILAASTYPGLVCVDQADTVAVLSHGKSAVIARYEASSFDEILRIGHARLIPNDRSVGVLAALFAPISLRLSNVHDMMNLVRKQLSNGRNTAIFAAVGNKKRDRFVLYITVSE